MSGTIVIKLRYKKAKKFLKEPEELTLMEMIEEALNPKHWPAGKKQYTLKEHDAALPGFLQGNLKQGAPLGKDCAKVRMKTSSRRRGKSGGASVIPLVKTEQNRITRLGMDDKADQETLTDKKLDDLIKQAPE